MLQTMTIGCLCLIFVILTGCTAPQYIWPQEDIAFSEINPATHPKKLLIASRQSDYKCLIVDKIHSAFKDQKVHIKTIGINGLRGEDANQYDAVLIINTSMGWHIDRKVTAYLNKIAHLDNIIVFTTAAGGDIYPDLDNREVDAMSSASILTEIDKTAEIIIQKIESRLGSTH